MPVPQPWTDEWDILEGIRDMLDANLADYASVSGLDQLVEIPTFTYSVTHDPTINAQHPSNQIQIYEDSSGTADQFATRNAEDDYMTVAIKVTFIFRPSDLGKTKTKYASTIRQIIRNRWREEIGPLGIYGLKTRAEIRYSSRRQTGGARRGGFGKPKPTGNHLENIVVFMYFRRRVEANIA